MLVWFCIRAKLRAHTLRHPCLACPSRCTEPIYPHDHCKRTITPRSHQPFSKPHYPSPRTKLASLVKGRWIDGKTQTVALLRFTCDMPTLFMLQTLLPSRRRDCHSITPSQNLTIPRKSPQPLPLNECSGIAISQKRTIGSFL